VIVGFAVFVVATVLLVSMGGAIVAAPLTLPALALVIRRHPTRGFRIAGAIIGGLTAAEVAWASRLPHRRRSAGRHLVRSRHDRDRRRGGARPSSAAYRRRSRRPSA
jgi:hypothetical protein